MIAWMYSGSRLHNLVTLGHHSAAHERTNTVVVNRNQCNLGVRMMIGRVANESRRQQIMLELILSNVVVKWQVPRLQAIQTKYVVVVYFL
jgi:hypothetical protein